MILAVVDTETSGFGDTDQILELAVAWLEHVTLRDIGWRVTGEKSWMMRPEVLVSNGARAAHHITDAMLADQPALAAWLRKNPNPVTPKHAKAADEIVFVAHNAAFDRRLLQQSRVAALPQRTICTWRCATGIWPDAESHKLQSLRYELELEIVEPDGQQAHRALHDVRTTTALVQRMLETKSVQELEAMTRAPLLLSTVRFGKHRGAKWRDVPRDYLSWVLTSDFDADVHHTAKHWLNAGRGA